MMTKLKQQVMDRFRHLWFIPESAYDTALSRVKLISASKIKPIKKVGDVDSCSRFLCEGFIGSFQFAEDELVLTNIFQVGDVVFDETSYLSGKASNVELKALCSVIFLELNKSDEDQLLKLVPDLYPLAHRIAHSIAEKNSKNVSISRMGIKKGYPVLMKEFPGLECVITNKDLGGFFGVSRRSAERFKQKLKFSQK